MTSNKPLTLWRTLLPYGYSYMYKASCARPSFVIFDIWALWRSHSDAQGWASECLDVTNYKWRLSPVWHRMLFLAFLATVGVKALTGKLWSPTWLDCLFQKTAGTGFPVTWQRMTTRLPTVTTWSWGVTRNEGWAAVLAMTKFTCSLISQ